MRVLQKYGLYVLYSMMFEPDSTADIIWLKYLVTANFPF